MADNKTKHGYDGCPACKAGVDIYQSPVVLPKNAIFAPVTAEDIATKPEKIIRSYLSLTDPEAFRKTMPWVLCNIATNKELVNALSSPDVVGLLDADLVETFIKQRKSPLIDAEHRVFSFLERFFHRKQGHDSHKEGDKLSTRHDLIGVTSRYLRRILSSPEKSIGARGDVLSYLLPQLVVALCDEQAVSKNPRLEAVRDAVCATILEHLPEQVVSTIKNPESYAVKIVEDEKGRISTRDKEMVAEEYATKTGIEFGFRKNKGEKDGRALTKVKYFGKEYELKGSHFHIGSPEHKKLSGTPEGEHQGELHHVFQAKDGGYLVIGSPIQAKKGYVSNPAVQEVLDAKFNKSRKPEEIQQFSLKDFIPDDEKLVTYFGGLTTTPYSDGVVFALSKTPLKISEEQFSALKKAQGVPDAARKTQKILGRHAVEAKLSMAENLAL